MPTGLRLYFHQFAGPSTGSTTWHYDRKVAGTNGTYDAGSYTDLAYSGDVEIEAHVPNYGASYFIGLTSGTPNVSGGAVQVGMAVDNGNIYAYDGASSPGAVSTGVGHSGDWMKLTRTVSDGSVKLYRKGPLSASYDLAYSFVNTNTATVRVDSNYRFTGNFCLLNIKDRGVYTTGSNWTDVNMQRTTSSLSIDASSYTIGSVATVTFTGAQNASDWFEILDATADPTNPAATLNWKYVNNTQTAGSLIVNGTVVINVPGTPGTYRVVSLYGDLYQWLLSSQVFTVV